MTGLRGAGLFCLFLLIGFGLGYPTLNRYDPRQTPGLSDVRSYAAMVTGAPAPGDAASQPQLEHLRFRVLVPWIARPFYHLAEGRLRTWDPVMFGLLVANSLFVAGTAMFIVVLGLRELGNYPVSLVASLLYLVNFAIPNLRLSGLVDAGEGFFLVALLWSLAERHLWYLPLIVVLGALTKESFVPLSIAFTTVWWLAVRRESGPKNRAALWIVISWVASFTSLLVVQRLVLGRWLSPIEFAVPLHGNHDYRRHFLSSIWDRNFWYIFLWLLPLATPRLNRFPRSWLFPASAACAMAFVLDGYYGGAPGTVARALFSVAGPILSLSAASLLCDPACAIGDSR